MRSLEYQPIHEKCFMRSPWGQPLPGRTAVPVLIEFPTRWFGTVRAVLASAEPASGS